MCGKLIFILSLIFLSISPLLSQSDSKQEVYKVVDQMPRFSDCENTEDSDGLDCSQLELFEFVELHLTYPKSAVENGTEGKVYVQFVVNVDGSLSDINVVRDIGDGCGDAAHDLLVYMNENHTWIPGRKDGEVVNVFMTLPIFFKQDEEVSQPEEEKFKIVDTMPRFPGCEDWDDEQEKKKCADSNLLRYIYNNLEFPKEARKAKVDDKLYLQFFVEEDGKLTDIEVVRSIGFGCDEAALKLMKKMQDEVTWIPGEQEGKPVRVKFTLPIKFKAKS